MEIDKIQADKLIIVGPDSTHASQETVDMLGRLLTHMMYGEIDKAAAMLMKLNTHETERLDLAVGNLPMLCSIDYS